MTPTILNIHNKIKNNNKYTIPYILSESIDEEKELLKYIFLLGFTEGQQLSNKEQALKVFEEYYFVKVLSEYKANNL